MSVYVPDYWQQGRLLYTDRTRRFSPEEWARNTAIEKCRVFRHFSAWDEGRARELVAVFESPEDAARAVRDHNAAVDRRLAAAEGQA